MNGLLMYDHCRARCHRELCSRHIAQSGHRIDLSVGTDNAVLAFWNIDLHRFGIAVEYHSNVFPLVSSRFAVQTEGYDASFRNFQEFQVLADQVGITQTEGRMRPAHGNQPLDIIEHLTMGGLVAPIDGIDLIRTVVRIMYSLLVAQHFVAGKDKGHSL